MHTTTNYLLVNLTVSDIITILLGPLLVTLILEGHLSNELRKCVCKLVALVEIATVASALSLTVLAVERYHALLKPFRAGLRLNKGNIKQAIAIIWISSVFICAPDFVLRGWSESNSASVGPWALDMNRASKVYTIITCILASYIPLVTLFYCYGSLIRGLYFTNTVCPDTSGERNSEKKKLITTFILVTAGFFISNVPLVVFNNVMASKDKEYINWKLDAQINLVLYFVFVCSLCLKPILYAFRSTKKGLNALYSAASLHYTIRTLGWKKRKQSAAAAMMLNLLLRLSI